MKPQTTKPLKILIAGMPKSGTTALFFKIGASIPGAYLPLFEPLDGQAVYRRTDLANVNLDEVTLLAKILCTPHHLSQHNLCRLPDVDYGSFKHYGRKIFLIRDPRDNLISLMLYMIVNTSRLIEPERAQQFVALLEKKEASPRAVSVVDILKEMSTLNECDFVKLFADWLSNSIQFIDDHPGYELFRYEHLVENKFEALEVLLGFPLQGAGVLPAQLGRVARTKSQGDWKNWFTPTDVDFFRPQHDVYLQHYKYPLDWEIGQQANVSQQFGSAYVRRIVNEFYENSRSDGQRI